MTRSCFAAAGATESDGQVESFHRPFSAELSTIVCVSFLRPSRSSQERRPDSLVDFSLRAAQFLVGRLLSMGPM